MNALTENVFETKMTSKGQVQIFKDIREQLGLSREQSFIERVHEGKVVLEPIPKLAALGGILGKPANKKGIKQIMKEVKEGWE